VSRIAIVPRVARRPRYQFSRQQRLDLWAPLAPPSPRSDAARTADAIGRFRVACGVGLYCRPMPNPRPAALQLLPLDQYVGVNRADPIRFYRWPIVGRAYRRRVEMCLAECGTGDRIL
jgi:hypothetical protein